MILVNNRYTVDHELLSKPVFFPYCNTTAIKLHVQVSPDTHKTMCELTILELGAIYCKHLWCSSYMNNLTLHVYQSSTLFFRASKSGFLRVIYSLFLNFTVWHVMFYQRVSDNPCTIGLFIYREFKCVKMEWI